MMMRLSIKNLIVLALGLSIVTVGIASRGEAHALNANPRASAIPGSEVQDREMEKAASRLYEGALRFYKQASYWKAARELITILDYYPAYSKIDGVLIYLGESLYNMQLYDPASRMFRYLATKYPNSRHLSQALHGLQRVYYQTGDVEESLKFYHDIVARFPSDETIDGAHYYGGMTYFQMQNDDSTVAALGKLRPRSEYFDVGLYTTGLALLKKKASTNRSKPFANC